MTKTLVEMKYPDGIPETLSIQEAAEVLGVSRPTLYRILKKTPDATVEGAGEARRVKTAWLFSYVDYRGERQSLVDTNNRP